MKNENITEKENSDWNNEYIRKAKEYMNCILYGVESFERHGQRPIIVMSQDILKFLQVFTQNTIKITNIKAITCCGRPVRIAWGENVLLVALDLRPMLEGGEG